MDLPYTISYQISLYCLQGLVSYDGYIRLWRLSGALRVNMCRQRYGRPKDCIVPRLLRIGMSVVDGNSVFLTRLLVEVVVEIDEPSEG